LVDIGRVKLGQPQPDEQLLGAFKNDIAVAHGSLDSGFVDSGNLFGNGNHGKTPLKIIGKGLVATLGAAMHKG
jgi:hypothetical protein